MFGSRQAMEQVQEVGIAGVVEHPEHVAADPAAVLDPRHGDRFLTDGLLEPLDRQALAGAVELEVDADSPFGHEEPGVAAAGGGGRLESGAEGEEALGAVGIAAAQLEPDVADMVAVRAAVGHQPRDRGAVAAGGIEPPGVSVEQERQQDLQRLGLAGAVLAAQQQAPTGEAQLDPVVLPDVDDPGAVQDPTAGRTGVVGRGPTLEPGRGIGEQRCHRHGWSCKSRVDGAGGSTTSGA